MKCLFFVKTNEGDSPRFLSHKQTNLARYSTSSKKFAMILLKQRADGLQFKQFQRKLWKNTELAPPRY